MLTQVFAPADLARLFGISFLFVAGTMVVLALVQAGGRRAPDVPERFRDRGLGSERPQERRAGRH